MDHTYHIGILTEDDSIQLNAIPVERNELGAAIAEAMTQHGIERVLAFQRIPVTAKQRIEVSIELPGMEDAPGITTTGESPEAAQVAEEVKKTLPSCIECQHAGLDGEEEPCRDCLKDSLGLRWEAKLKETLSPPTPPATPTPTPKPTQPPTTQQLMRVEDLDPAEYRTFAQVGQECGCDEQRIGNLFNRRGLPSILASRHGGQTKRFVHVSDIPLYQAEVTRTQNAMPRYRQGKAASPVTITDQEDHM